MSLIKWRDSYNTGVTQFDEEHHKIVELIQKLFEAVRTDLGGDFDKIIQDLVNYTEYHFTNEEKAMADAGYPELDEHRKEHEELMAQAGKFREISRNMNREQVRELYQFLRDWLVDHIVVCDKKYGEYLTATTNKK